VSTPTGYYDLPEVGPTVEDCDMVRPSPNPPRGSACACRMVSPEPHTDHHRDGAERRRAEHAGLRDEPGDGPEPAADPRLRQPQRLPWRHDPEQEPARRERVCSEPRVALPFACAVVLCGTSSPLPLNRPSAISLLTLSGRQVNTAIHEIFHAMGFSGHMVRHFPPSLGASYLHRRRTTRSPRRKRTRRRMD
jgi:hypothetical protein